MRNNNRWAVQVAGRTYKQDLTRWEAQQIAESLQGCVHGVKSSYRWKG